MSTPAHEPAGQPTGGQFAKTFHSDAVPALPVPATPLTFQGQASLDPSSYPDLPALPASVGIPEVSFSFSDEGKLETDVKIHGTTMSFWRDEMTGDVANTADDGHTQEGEFAPWSGIAEYEDFEQARTWAEAVHERVEGATEEILENAVQTDEARKAIINFATGRPTEEAAELTPSQSSAKRAAAAMAVCDEGEGAETTMRDLLTDLRHYADAKGIDIYQAMDESHGYYLHEKADPYFTQVF
ncbi:MAG TPA: hypothetical protein VF867_01305 [Arthrobacter sp.]